MWWNWPLVRRDEGMELLMLGTSQYPRLPEALEEAMLRITNPELSLIHI